MPECPMIYNDFAILLVSDRVADTQVFGQMFATYTETIHLSRISSMQDIDEQHYDLIITRDPLPGQNDTPDTPVITLDDAPIKIGLILDMVETHLFKSTYNTELSYGDYDLRAVDHTFILKHHGREIILTETERNIIYALMTAKDQGLHRDALLKKVWDYNASIETHTLETHIYRLRQKIENNPSQPQYITIEHGIYRLR